MIFKVLQADTRRWFYYDDIFLFKVKYDIRILDQPISGDEIVLLPEEREPDQEVVYCNLNFKNSNREYLTIVFNTEAYLLNDEGKTIEKIN